VSLIADTATNLAIDIEQKVHPQCAIMLRPSTNEHFLLLTPPYDTKEEFLTVAESLRKVLTSFATLTKNASKVVSTEYR
jgi:23S rRNA A2030 N6-methylase RlmJ